MCGFIGALSFGPPIRESVAGLQDGLAAIRHRGPDATAEYLDDSAYLGHNRLSIIDLSDAANQPLKSVNSDAWIVYNGEIYNYADLRQPLESRTRFATRSDTEVLLEGYLIEGEAFFRKLRGIYAFAILDRRSDTRLVLGRDPAGVKPLYFSQHGEVLIFGSEIKGLTPVRGLELTINEPVVKTYLNLGYCPEPHTVYNEIHALTPGTVLTVSRAGWREASPVTPVFGGDNGRPFGVNVGQVERLLAQAVRRNLVADVETAVALSGGIDSALIYAFATRTNGAVRALTVRFDDPEFDEAGAALRYARHLGGRAEVLPVEGDFGLPLLDRLLLHFDQPFADTSFVPVYYLTKAARRHTKVLLGGDGGDELFNGYASMARLPYALQAHRLGCAHSLAHLLAGLSRMSAPEASRTLSRVSALLAADPADMLFDWMSWLPRHTRFDGRSPFTYDANDGLALYQSVFRERQPSGFAGSLVFEHFTKTLLSDYLRKTDMMSMLNGVEYRVPLLDEDLVRYSMSIPFEQKSSWCGTKRPLRRLHEKLFPASTSRAPKRGFAIPLDMYLSANDVRAMREVVLSTDSVVRSYVHDDYLQFLFDVAGGTRQDFRHVSRAGTYHRTLLFYSLALWHRSKPHLERPRDIRPLPANASLPAESSRLSA